MYTQIETAKSSHNTADQCRHDRPNLAWMDSLLELASHGRDIVSASLGKVYRNDMQSCYEYCNRVTEHHSKSFFLASSLLPRDKRNGVRALYAFCRTTDDIIDLASEDLNDKIERWRKDTANGSVRFNDPVAIAWTDARERFQIPDIYPSQLIDGVEMDIWKKRYQDFEELSRYCYGVASTVGLMSMHIVGYLTENALPYAIKLGVALQLTNILRDIQEDWERGRVYLPADEMAAFGISEDHFRFHTNDHAWKQFMRFQIDRARALYEEAWPGIQMLHPDGRLAIGAAAVFYRDILKKIESNDYDVFSRRAYVSKWGKIRRLPDLMIKFKYASSLNSIFS